MPPQRAEPFTAKTQWLDPEQRITVAQAVHEYIIGSAFAEHQEDIKGPIEPGKLADLVVLSDDVFTIPPAAIERTKVNLTIFDGKLSAMSLVESYVTLGWDAFEPERRSGTPIGLAESRLPLDSSDI